MYALRNISHVQKVQDKTCVLRRDQLFNLEVTEGQTH